jgi:hypothetical protein
VIVPDTTYTDDFMGTQIWGDSANVSQIPGNWNPSGQTPDWGAIISAGVTNTVNNLMNAAVGNAVQSGQLQYYSTSQSRTTSLLLVAALVFFLVN